jgi:hypothetical protein
MGSLWQLQIQHSEEAAILNYIAPCPNCGTTEKTQWVSHELIGRTEIDIMCWKHCGMDFQVNGLWWMLNRIEVED